MILRMILAGVVIAATFLSQPALAHPHVWVVSKSELLFSPDRKLVAIRHVWSFDEAYSAFVTQGLDTNNDGVLSQDELAGLAKTNIESLVEFNYFTVLKAGGQKQAFGTPTDYRLDFKDRILTLTFVLPLAQPVAATKAMGLEIYDPTYFVSFGMDPGPAAVTLAGAQGCAINVSRPKQETIDLPQKNLSEAFFNALSATSDYGLQFANKAVIACP